MRILFDLYHPSHVHLFKNSIWRLEELGHEVLITSRDKEVTVNLLDSYNLDHMTLSGKQSGRIGLITETGKRIIRLTNVARQFDPDIVAGRINPVSVYAAKLSGAEAIMFKDSDYLTSISKITHPLVDVMYIPSNFDINLGDIEHRVDGFQELAYLHPDWFQPDSQLLKEYGIDPDEQYFVLRFVSMDAHHDEGHHGFSPTMKRQIVSTLDQEGTVYITSEQQLDSEFEQYRLPLPPHHIHHLLAFANLYIGDSQTMATEAALLGTPAIRSNSFANGDDLSNFIELEEEYCLLYSFSDEKVAFDKIMELVAQDDLQDEWEQRRERLTTEKTDVTKDMIDLFLKKGGTT
ncbi:DUF354 domain-containing protein [Natronococcus jeotgali]|uniref:DUF354 domain-containing protein n=1 Tax=Natronococcus jeotgali DSM 18795 TaxID=1227498 RepID=L9X3Y1_9EURY|nr:DUF354 domain-containing protein [Natronococcus jeotgali]ELY56415.1 hypothetical protein C492_14976 [Natronococcus jeotgali DSM 18795]